jgi:dipeptidyl aminopeptidase/acylaminoacyl peptidase
LFADKFKTPTLVIHGQNDYRLDVSEGFQTLHYAATAEGAVKDVVFPG